MPASIEPRPFLKWAGGKRQLLPHLRCFYPASIKKYFEPFVGSGAVFFDLSTTGRLDGAPAALSDENADLIGTYHRVRDDTDAVIDRLETLETGHRRNGREHYYEIRDQQFNPGRDTWRRLSGRPEDYPVALAAMLLYLNRSGYNGLFRLNGAGHFNVPAGSYENPSIVKAARLRAAADSLNSPSVAIRHTSFELAVTTASAGDLVYLDPPYAPLSATASFRSYTAQGFTAADQRRLRDVVVALSASGVAVILSNSTAPSILALYDTREARRAGLRCWRAPARRAINSRGDRRGHVEELIVSNVEQRSGNGSRTGSRD